MSRRRTSVGATALRSECSATRGSRGGKEREFEGGLKEDTEGTDRRRHRTWGARSCGERHRHRTPRPLDTLSTQRSVPLLPGSDAALVTPVTLLAEVVIGRCSPRTLLPMPLPSPDMAAEHRGSKPQLPTSCPTPLA
jgi:hypothetical protein